MRAKLVRTLTAGFLGLLNLALLSACGSSGTAAVPPANSLPLAVTSTHPAANATGVSLNGAITATFNAAMNPSTITPSTFIVTSSSGPLTGIVTLNGKTATFTPAASLPANTQLTATITSSARDQSGNPLSSPYSWRFSTGSTVDATPPAVLSTSPANGATGVAQNTDITVTFSEPMTTASITGTTFSLATSSAGTPVAGTVSLSGTTAMLVPTTPLAASTSYTATITTGAKDLAGNSLPGNVSFSFTTGSGQDAIRPTVLSSSPTDNATGISVATAVTVTFSESMNPATINSASFILASGAGAVPGKVSLNGNIATFTPTILLAGNTAHIATITTSATDQAGNHLITNHSFTFTTGPDTVPPVVTTTVPASNATNVIRTNPTITATFSKAMNPATITVGTFTLSSASLGPLFGNVTLSGTSAQFIPLTSLPPNDICTATITTGATDLAGNHLPANYIWSFVTGP